MLYEIWRYECKRVYNQRKRNQYVSHRGDCHEIRCTHSDTVVIFVINNASYSDLKVRKSLESSRLNVYSTTPRCFIRNSLYSSWRAAISDHEDEFRIETPTILIEVRINRKQY